MPMQQLDPKAFWLFFLSSLLRWGLFILIFLLWFVGFLFDALVEGEDFQAPYWLGIVFFVVPIVMFLVLFVWAKLSYRFYKYELADVGFRKELGVINKKYVTIPYDRIQNVDIDRNLLARILGLSTLSIQTAGYSGAKGFGNESEGRLPGLSQETAEQLRNELIRRAGQTRSQGV